MNEADKIYKDLAVGILANSKCRRIPGNKAFLQYKNKNFLDLLLDQFSEFENVYISTDQGNSTLNKYQNLIFDKNIDVGPMEGIYQILKNSKCNYNFICAVDMPFLQDNVAKSLYSKTNDCYDCYVISDKDGIHPTCAIYTKKLIPIIDSLIKNKKYKLKFIFDDSNTKYIDVQNLKIDRKTLININTSKDYEKYCK